MCHCYEYSRILECRRIAFWKCLQNLMNLSNINVNKFLVKVRECWTFQMTLSERVNWSSNLFRWLPASNLSDRVDQNDCLSYFVCPHFLKTLISEWREFTLLMPFFLLIWSKGKIIIFNHEKKTQKCIEIEIQSRVISEEFVSSVVTKSWVDYS